MTERPRGLNKAVFKKGKKERTEGPNGWYYEHVISKSHTVENSEGQTVQFFNRRTGEWGMEK